MAGRGLRLRDRKGKIGEEQLAKMSEARRGPADTVLVSVLRAVILGVYE